MRRFGPPVIVLAVFMAAPTFGGFSKSGGCPGGRPGLVGYHPIMMGGYPGGRPSGTYTLTITSVGGYTPVNGQILEKIPPNKDLDVVVEANFYTEDPGPTLYLAVDKERKAFKRKSQHQKMAPKTLIQLAASGPANGTTPYPSTLWENLYTIPYSGNLLPNYKYVLTATYPGAMDAPPVHFETGP